MEKKKINADGTFMWLYENQTRMKHNVFKDYFDVWSWIIGNSYGSLNYIDCFGGCGMYYDNKGDIYYGSPILAAQSLSKKTNLKNKFGFIIIDKSKDNIENLKNIFKVLKINFEPHFINKDFDEVMNKEILDSSKNLAPTFFFVDPFGIKVKMNTLKRMMEEVRKPEILLNFMFNGVNRNITVPQSEEVLTDLYGSKEWKVCGTEEEKVDCFRKKLKEFSKYVIPYKINFPEQDRTYYYLFHLSNHWKGASIMKDCFSKYNHGRIEYLGKRGDQLTLFDVKEVKIPEIKNFLLNEFRRHRINYLSIIEKLIDTTPYLEREISLSLKELEKDGKIRIDRNPPLTPKTKKIRTSLELLDELIFI